MLDGNSNLSSPLIKSICCHTAGESHHFFRYGWEQELHSSRLWRVVEKDASYLHKYGSDYKEKNGKAVIRP